MVVRFTGLHLRRVCILPTSRFTPATASASIGPSRMKIFFLITSNWNWKCRWQVRPIIRGGIRMDMPTDRIPWEASATR